MKKIGLTEYEARIYTSLVKTGPKSATEVSFLSKVPRTKTYGALRSLERKKLISMMPGRPEKYTANSPELLFPLVEKISREITECSDTIKKLTIAYESLKYVHPEWPMEKREYWILKNGEETFKAIKSLINESSNSINILSRGEGVVRIYKNHYEELENAMKRNVSIRLIAPITLFNRSMMRDFSRVADIKTLEVQFPFEYLCIDLRKIIFMKFYDKGFTYDERCISVLIEDPLIVEIHKRLFDIFLNRCLS
ncbi:MAG: helix-turn-helix domain-containing protein [Candidatus Bathyarchaeia archaeon]